MIIVFKKLLFNATINIIFFLILLVGIQNSTKKTKVNFLTYESIKLPVSFIIGTSFVSGTFLGGLLTLNFFKKDGISERY